MLSTLLNGSGLAEGSEDLGLWTFSATELARDLMHSLSRLSLSFKRGPDQDHFIIINEHCEATWNPAGWEPRQA